jgi:hypothetical protein
MKKYAIAIVGLVLAAFVFGACESNNGGTIRVTNASNELHVNIYVTDSFSSDPTPPTKGVVAEKRIEPGAIEDIIIPEDGTYYVKPFFLKIEKDNDGNDIIGPEKVGKAEPDSGMVYLLGGGIESIKVTPK